MAELMNEQVSSNNPGKYIEKEYEVMVSEKVASLNFDFKLNKPAWLTCMVYDEQNNLRGQILKAGQSGSILIHEQIDQSSPYTVAGAINTGKWLIDLIIMTDQDVPADDTWAEITICDNQGERNERNIDKLIWNAKDTTAFSLTDFDNHQVFSNEKKWYKGDFHTHTTYSDGEMSREENMDMAAKQGLDFFVATDHNIVPTSWHEETNTLVIPGTEVTSTLGHFNVINPNTSPFVKNSIRDMYDEEGTNRIIAEDYGDALVSINHPFLKGCPWIYKDTILGNIDTIEIINDPTYPDNPIATEQALIAWDILLNDGYRITGIGGSDSHLRPDDHYDGSANPSLIGDPGTYVYCDGLTACNLMDSVRKGNVTISRGGFISMTDGKCLPGETSHLSEGEVFAEVDTDDDIYIEWIVDGEKVKTSKTTSASYTFDFAENEYHWIRVDVRYADSSIYGFTNPIYFGEKQPQIKTWHEVVQKMDINK